MVVSHWMRPALQASLSLPFRCHKKAHTHRHAYTHIHPPTHTVCQHSCCETDIGARLLVAGTWFRCCHLHGITTREREAHHGRHRIDTHMQHGSVGKHRRPATQGADREQARECESVWAGSPSLRLYPRQTPFVVHVCDVPSSMQSAHKEKPRQKSPQNNSTTGRPIKSAIGRKMPGWLNLNGQTHTRPDPHAARPTRPCQQTNCLRRELIAFA